MWTTSVTADKSKSYLEPDSVELEVLQYLNDTYDSIVLLVNSSAAMELDWVAEFPNIKSVVYVASMGTYGMFGLADVFSGTVSPSGHTVDTFAANAFSSPAAQNYGDYQYVDESGAMTDYNYVTYKEGIYVGYRYYETRYEDVVLNQGNAGNFDYNTEVVYPFGYGLSYAKSGLARFVCNIITSKLNKSIEKGEPDLNITFIYNMPFRGIAKMAGGMCTIEMAEGILSIVNGHFFKGLGRVIGGFFRSGKKRKAANAIH